VFLPAAEGDTASEQKKILAEEKNGLACSELVKAFRYFT
jgi:hypothetical protein